MITNITQDEPRTRGEIRPDQIFEDANAATYYFFSIAMTQPEQQDFITAGHSLNFIAQLRDGHHVYITIAGVSIV